MNDGHFNDPRVVVVSLPRIFQLRSFHGAKRVSLRKNGSAEAQAVAVHCAAHFWGTWGQRSGIRFIPISSKWWAVKSSVELRFSKFLFALLFCWLNQLINFSIFIYRLRILNGNLMKKFCFSVSSSTVFTIWMPSTFWHFFSCLPHPHILCNHLSCQKR